MSWLAAQHWMSFIGHHCIASSLARLYGPSRRNGKCNGPISQRPGFESERGLSLQLPASIGLGGAITALGILFLRIIKIRYSLAGQDTQLSPERPGFASRWRNCCTARRRSQDIAQELSGASRQREGMTKSRAQLGQLPLCCLTSRLLRSILHL